MFIFIFKVMYILCLHCIFCVAPCCRFDEVSNTLEPVDDGTADRCFISKSYDATR